jgi:hypothetical protein
LEFAVTFRDRFLDSERRVHTAEMLCEEIFAVELVAFTLNRALRTRRTAVKCKAEMLRCDVTLPFVLRAERASTAGEGEGAWEWSGMSGGDVFSE